MKKILPAIFLLSFIKSYSQQTINVTDAAPVTYNGLQAGYTLETEEEKEVGKKGDFSRFKIHFFLTNTSAEAVIMYRRPNFGGHFGSASNNIAQFNCLNATGARLTNKMVNISLKDCSIEAMVTQRDCATGKDVQVSQMVNIGYWIKPGETINVTTPMIVPLNEKPNMTVTFYSEPGNQVGTFSHINNNNQQQNYDAAYSRIKNFAFNTYLNNQTGPVNCSTIETGWWSADWQIISVQGTNSFQIKNHWTNNYLCSDYTMLTDNANASNAMWTIEETATSNVFYIKNVSNGAKLYIENGQLKISNSYISNDNASKWIIEK